MMETSETKNVSSSTNLQWFSLWPLLFFPERVVSGWIKQISLYSQHWGASLSRCSRDLYDRFVNCFSDFQGHKFKRNSGPLSQYLFCTGIQGFNFKYLANLNGTLETQAYNYQWISLLPLTENKFIENFVTFYTQVEG